jgi:anti-sigma28 factor (negative regulator of flagellin synthesis)
MIMVHRENKIPASRIEMLRKKIDNGDYLYEAIQRIAQVLSNEILDIPQGGMNHERQRKGRK